MKYVAQKLTLLTIAALLASAASAQPSVLTQAYDIGRSGANLNETILTPSNVSSSKFGKLFAYPVDEEIFAQPLYVPNLAINGVTHNVVFIATMGNSVYAFDADNPSTSATPLWSVNLGTPVPSSVFSFVSAGQQHSGIYSTPVIDPTSNTPTSNTMYVWTHLWNTATQSETQKLHALDITSGAEKFGGPVTISAPGFDPVINEQRVGLLLLHGTLYVAIGDHGDLQISLSTLLPEPYQGMVLAYDATTLLPVGSFNAEPNGLGAGIWQGGRGLASDGTYIYAMTANMYTKGTADYSEQFLKFNPVTLSLADSFPDPDAACLNKLDMDLAAAGPLVVPGTGTNLLMGGGKAGKVYALQLDEPLSTQTATHFWGTVDHATLPSDGGTCVRQGTTQQGWLMGNDSAFWQNPGGDSYFYAFGNSDSLMSWQLSDNAFIQTSSDTPTSFILNELALSANGGSNGILWTVTNKTPNGNAIVSAYNAVPSAGHLTPLWNSAQLPKRDLPGVLGRYSMPTIANGKVYVATASNQVAVYGLLPAAPAIVVTPQDPNLASEVFNQTGQYIYVTSVGGFSGTVSLSATGMPAGVTYSFTPSTVTVKAGKTAQSVMKISSGTAVLPLNRNYTLVVQGSAAGGVKATAPIRAIMADAWYTSVTKVACNSSKQMNASLSWEFIGSNNPSIWIQDPTSPNFPGRLWMEPVPDIGTQQTGYTTKNTKRYLYWLIDQSNGIPANFDNAFKFTNLGSIYKCP